MNLNEANLEGLKAVELDMFRTFLKICQKYNLQYFLLGGTALGAVRHKGFIPWDDDIDVGMPREAYNKFLACAQQELPDNLFLQTHVTDKDYPTNYAKIRNSDTTFIETSAQNLNINHGVFIDIFPLDGASANRFVRKVRRWYYTFLGIKISRVFVLENRQKGLKKFVLDFLIKTGKTDYRKLVRKRDKFLHRYAYAESNIVANFNGAWGVKEVMPKAIFGEGTKGTFEGIEVRLPEKYDLYLSQMYGDYMTPPPKEKQMGHHYCTVIDVNRSYTVYMEKGKRNEKSDNVRNI